MEQRKTLNMKKLITIIFLFISVGVFGQSFNNNANIYNVKLFGAKGDGTTNDGPALRAAVAMANIFGGKIYIPHGIYADRDTIITECNCQIEIPQVNGFSASRTQIIIEGEAMNTEPNGAGSSAGATVPPPTLGSIIYSKLATNSGAGAAIIGSKTTGGFNITSLEVRNIGLEVRNNPSGHGPVVGGINWRYGCNFKFDHVQAFIDTAGYRSTAPGYDVTGIEAPDNNSGENYSIVNCAVQGFRNGYKTGEHVVFDNSNAVVCYKGFDFKAGIHNTTATRCGAFECAYDIYAEGAVTLSSFHIDAEWQSVGKWYDDINTVKDSANLLTGQLYYTIIQASVGKNNAKFSISGGANLHTSTDDAGTTSIMTIGVTVASGTANSVLYLGASNVLAQDNANFFYDYTNHRLGLGTTAPGSQLEIKATAPYLTINAGTSGQGGILFQKSGTTKWSILQDFGSAGVADFAIYDVVNSKTKFYSDGSGNVNIGGTATVAGTSTIAIDNSNNVIMNLGTTTLGTTTIPTVRGSTASGGTLTLTSTSNATKGKILLGASSVFDEVNNDLVIGATSVTAGAYAIEIDKANPYLHLNSTTSRQAGLIYSYNATPKFQMAMDFANSGTADFYIYDQARSAVRFYINGTNGTTSLGGAATATSTAGINITSGQVVSIPNLTASKVVFTDASKNLSSAGIGTSSQLIAGDGSLVTTTTLAGSPNGTINILASTQTTLVAGTKALSVTGVTTGSHAYINAVSQGGTVSTTFEYAVVCTSGTVTITALTTGNVTNTLDTSVVNVFVTN